MKFRKERITKYFTQNSGFKAKRGTKMIRCDALHLSSQGEHRF